MNDASLNNLDVKQALLTLLDDVDVRETIRQIMAEPDNAAPTEIQTPTLEGLVKSDLELIEQLQDEKEYLKTKINTLSNENEEMKAIIEKLKSLLGLKEEALNESTQSISELNQHKIELEADLSSVNADLNQNKQHLSEISSQYQNLKREFDSLKQDHEEQERKIGFYRDAFEDDLRIKELYDGLSSQTKLSTEGIFKDTTIKGLIACGIQDKNISNLWDYVKSEVVNGTNPDQERIIRLFELLFHRYKLAYPMFELQQVEVGDKFDTQSHIKHNSSENMSGSIQDVLFYGYINTKTDKVIKASIVVV
ncbi:hypothetical protein GNP89_01230 [Aliivibrio fischeri]|uniref:hypothetical protein n=1 Tax=Aliivibrio fischeri TaxID=668 RepID=UPI0012D9B16E|nr:hypothetical protein [Aliivibrio fischeri]MUL00836.1 hypothetical protein [Aliivibrio fischeri]